MKYIRNTELNAYNLIFISIKKKFENLIGN